MKARKGGPSLDALKLKTVVQEVLMRETEGMTTQEEFASLEAKVRTGAFAELARRLDERAMLNPANEPEDAVKTEHAEAAWEPRPYKEYRWIVKDDALLGGKLAIRGTRVSVAQIRECLALNWTHEELNDAFGEIPAEAMHEVLNVSAEDLS